MIGKYFKLRERQTGIKIECVAGLTTFLTMAYIIFANPSILSLEGIPEEDLVGISRMDKDALIAVTCIVTAITTIIVGIVANAPIAMAPGMGLNAFFAYLVASRQMDWQTALGVVFVSGLLFLIATLLGLRKRIVEAIPRSLVSAIAVGIGLFITFIGLKNLGVIVKDPITFVSAGPLTLTVLIGLFGLLVMIFFEMKKISGGLVMGILASTILAMVFDKEVEMPQQLISLHLNIQTIAFHLDIAGALKWGFFGTIFTLTFIDMFDSVGTLVACCHQANMVDEQGKIKGLDRLLGHRCCGNGDRRSVGDIYYNCLYRIGSGYRARRTVRLNFHSYRGFVPDSTIIRPDCGHCAALCNRTGSHYGRAVYDEGN